jgi:6-phosphogluconolactonase
VAASSKVIVDNPPALAKIFATLIVDLRRTADRLSLALPGGSVADAFLPELALAPIDWRRIDLFWSDERAVPPDHPDSNFRLASERLLSRIVFDPIHVHRMKGEADDLDRAAADHEWDMRRVLGSPPRLDVVLLGVGPDGHVCSLFPSHPALAETTRFAVAVRDAPKPPPERLTLTLPALAGAFIVLAAFGESKARAIADVLDNPASRLPAALAVRGASEALFLLDENAAGRSSSL